VRGRPTDVPRDPVRLRPGALDTAGVDSDVTGRWASEELGRLYHAVASGDIDAAARALADGADPNDAGPRMLNLVALEGTAEMAQLLIEHGAQRDRETVDGWTALTIADAWGNGAVAAVLESAGADPAQRSIHGFSDLHRAAPVGDIEAMERAMTVLGVDVVDATGDTALSLAIEH